MTFFSVAGHRAARTIMGADPFERLGKFGGTNKAWYSNHLKTRPWNPMTVFNSNVFFSMFVFTGD